MNRGVSICDFQASPAGDWSPAFAAAFASLADCTHATVHIPDGDFGVLQPVHVPNHVSIAMAPAARLFALPAFTGEAVVIKGERPVGDLGWEAHGYSGRIGGGIIDGGKLPIHGVIGRWTRRFVLHDLEVFNCLAGGIRIGEQGWYETTLRGVRVQIDFDVTCLPDAIGVEVVRGSDNQVTQLLTIGYDIGVKGASGSTCWHQVHVWKGRHRPFKIGFHCGGWNDCFSQCQCDECENIGFLVDAPFQRFDACMVQQGQKSVRHKGERIAVRLTGRGTHCFFAGTFINPAENALFAKVFDGSLEGCTVVGTLYNQHVRPDSLVNQFASGTGGASWQPVVGFSGQGVRLADACAEVPQADDGQIGEVRWMTERDSATLYLKTPRGWTRCRMEKS